MFATMETLPIKYFDTHAHGDIMSIYTNDIDTLRQMISQSFPQLLSSVITIVSVLVSMLILNVPLTVVTLLMVAIMMTASRKLAGLSLSLIHISCISVLAGWVLLDQKLSIKELLGCVIMFAAIILAQLPEKEKDNK